MPSLFNFEREFYRALTNLERRWWARPLILGGIAGSGGGIGGPPGGFSGVLPQTRVAYDTDELAVITTVSGEESLLDNLNHIRYRVSGVEELIDDIIINSGVAHQIWYEDIEYPQRTKLRFMGDVYVEDNIANGSTDVHIIISGLPDWWSFGDIEQNDFWIANGDLAVGLDVGSAQRLPVGDDLQILMADSTEVLGIKWQTFPELTGLRVEEIDGSPTVSGVGTIKVTNGSLTDNGGGVVTITIPSGAAGVDNFLDLTDTPDSFATYSGAFVKVNGTEDGLEFGTALSGNKIIRYDYGGTIAEEYDFDTTGLRSALTDSASGDVVQLPAGVLTCTDIVYNGARYVMFTVPDGVTLKGMGIDKTLLNLYPATVSNNWYGIYLGGSAGGSSLEDITLDITNANSATRTLTGFLVNLGTAKNVHVYVTSTGIANVMGGIVYTRNYANKYYYAIDNVVAIVNARRCNEAFYVINDEYDANVGYRHVNIRNITGIALNIDTSYSSGLYFQELIAAANNTLPYIPAIQAINCTGIVKRNGTPGSLGIFGISTENSYLVNCTGIVIDNVNNTSTTEDAYGIYGNASSIFENCTGIANVNTNSPNTAGIYAIGSIIRGGRFIGQNSDVDGASYGITAYGFWPIGYDGDSSMEEVWAYNASFKGTTADIRIEWGWLKLNACTYSTVQYDELLCEIVPFQGDRGSYYVNQYHSDDIDSSTFFHHLPSPSGGDGYVAVTENDEWKLILYSGYENAFLTLTDTPDDYTNFGGWIVGVKSDQTGLQFISLSGAGTGDMMKSTYDPDDDGLIDGNAISITVSGEAPTTEGFIVWDDTTKNLEIYDSQRGRSSTTIGWTPFAYQPNYNTTSALSSGLTLAANGGSIALPIHINGHMLLQSVTFRNTNTSLARSWRWDLYAQYLNNGNVGENTLTRVAASDGSGSFTPTVASTRTLNVSGAPVYLGPGLYWLVIQCTHATNNLTVAYTSTQSYFNSASPYQTKTTTNPNGDTLDFVTGWFKSTAMIHARLDGRIFGETTAYG